MPPRKTKKARTASHSKAQTAHQSSIDLRVVVILLTIIVCCVFLWGFLNRNAQESNAAAPEKERTIITRPTEDNQ